MSEKIKRYFGGLVMEGKRYTEPGDEEENNEDVPSDTDEEK